MYRLALLAVAGITVIVLAQTGPEGRESVWSPATWEQDMNTSAQDADPTNLPQHESDQPEVSPVDAVGPELPDPSALVGPVSSVEADPGAATGLHARVGCEPPPSRVALADLHWTVAAVGGSEQRVALTIFREGFDTGAFQVSPRLPPDASAYTWRGLNAGGVHHWRVLTRHDQAWTASPTEVVVGPTCVADFVAPGAGP
jgi:hypothetical protein